MVPPTGGSIQRVQTQNPINTTASTTAAHATAVMIGLAVVVSTGIASIGSARSLVVTVGRG